MFAEMVMGVMLLVLLMALALGRAAAVADEQMDAVGEEPDWWDDPEWEWPAVTPFERELTPWERHVYERLVRR